MLFLTVISKMLLKQICSFGGPVGVLPKKPPVLNYNPARWTALFFIVNPKFYLQELLLIRVDPVGPRGVLQKMLPSQWTVCSALSNYSFTSKNPFGWNEPQIGACPYKQ